VNPEQARAVINTAILTAVIDRGPTVISMPGDVAASDAPYRVHEVAIPVAPVFRPADADMEKLAAMIEPRRGWRYVDSFALSLPSHLPFHTAAGYTLSLAKQVLSGRMDSVIKTIERNVRLV
jgi:hypothetical protein